MFFLTSFMPLACSNELAAVEFFEEQRWGNLPTCAHCGSTDVYKMTDAATGERNMRFLWRCRGCGKQYTVRIGTVYEETRLDLRHWCYAFWRAATSKKGVAALEIKRQCQISYKSALFLMNRIRFAMAPDADAPKLTGIIEADETYVGGKPRPGIGQINSGQRTFQGPPSHRLASDTTNGHDESLFMKKHKHTASRPKETPGAKPEVLKIEGDWRAAVRSRWRRRSPQRAGRSSPPP